MKLNQSELRGFFYGTMLGDSGFHNGSFNCRQITKSLIEFKAEIIDKYIPQAKVKITTYPEYTDKNGVFHRENYYLYSSPTEYFKKMEKLFYPNGTKIYPPGTAKKLGALGFAMWYADDGTTVLVGKNINSQSANSRRVQFCTDGFSLESTLSAQTDMRELGYDCKILDRKRNGQYRIEITPQDGQRLFQELEPFFYQFPEMLYKLDLGYREKSLQYRRYVSEEYEALYSRISAHPQFIDRMIGR